jgi:hypothetical protein
VQKAYQRVVLDNLLEQCSCNMRNLQRSGVAEYLKRGVDSSIDANGEREGWLWKTAATLHADMVGQPFQEPSLSAVSSVVRRI